MRCNATKIHCPRDFSCESWPTDSISCPKRNEDGPHSQFWITPGGTASGQITSTRLKCPKSTNLVVWGFCVTGNTARTDWTVGMDLLACHECVEVVFIDHSMIYDRLVLHFGSGSTISHQFHPPEPTEIIKYCCVGFSSTGNSARTAWMVGMDLPACHECVDRR